MKTRPAKVFQDLIVLLVPNLKKSVSFWRYMPLLFRILASES